MKAKGNGALRALMRCFRRVYCVYIMLIAIKQLLNHDHAIHALHDANMYHISFIINVQYSWNTVFPSLCPSLRGKSLRTIEKNPIGPRFMVAL